MRTLSTKHRTLKDRAADLIGGERRYDVSGEIVFRMFFIIRGPDQDVLREAVCEIATKFPWRDDEACAHSYIRRETFYLGDGRVSFDGHTAPVKCISFTIHPEPGTLRKGQVYAYEQYLAKLAKELAKRFSKSVDEVLSVMEVRSMTHFRTY